MIGLGLSIPEVVARQRGPNERFPLAGASIALDFANDRSFGGEFSTHFTYTRSGPATDLLWNDPAGRAYRSFADNVPPITPGRGMLIEETRRNLLLNAATPANHSTSFVSAGNHVLWINAEPGASVTITPGTAVINIGGVAQTSITVSHGVPVPFSVGTVGSVTVTVSGTVHAMQMEPAGSLAPTSFIPTGGTAQIRGNAGALAKGSLLALISATTGAVAVRARAATATANFAVLHSDTAAVLNRNSSDTTGFGANNQASGNVNFTLGAGGWLSGARAALAWSPSTRSLVANGGTVSTGGTLKARTTVWSALGSNNGTAQFWNGFIERVDYFQTRPDDPSLRRMTEITSFDLAMYGDSLTARADGPEPVKRSVPAYLGSLFAPARLVFNGGVEGDTSTSTRTRFLSTYLYGLPTIVWTGYNDRATPATVLSNIATIVGALTTDKYLILSPPNPEAAISGTADYDNFIAVRDGLNTAYGTRFLDMRALMVSYEPVPGDPVDVLRRTHYVPVWNSRLVVNQVAMTTAVADAVTQAITLPFSPGINTVVKIGDEYVYVTAATGANVTACTRGYAGSTASAHAIGEIATRRDPTHFNDAARLYQAQQIYAKVSTLGWG